MKRSGSDLFYCVCMILVTPASVLFALNADWFAARAASPRSLRLLSERYSHHEFLEPGHEDGMSAGIARGRFQRLH